MANRNIEIKGLTFSYGRAKQVLSDITFHIESGENIGVIGANGVGKSTLLKLIVGLLSDYEGGLQVNGMNVEKENLSSIRKQTGYVFQDSDSQMFMSTVYEDVAFAPRNYGFSENDTEEAVKKALEMVHIEHLKEHHIYRLSGGEKKLASIATILATEPDIILLDEPSVALDPRNRRNLIQVLNELECLKMIASHDLDLIWDTCERTILLSEGQIIIDGNTKEILTNKELLEENGLEVPLSLSRR